MERKYAGTFKTCKHPFGKWRNIAKWRPVGVPGEWHQVSHLTTVPCSMEEGDNTGKRKAESEGRVWFNALIANEGHRTELEDAETQSKNDGHNLTAKSTVADYCAYYIAERLPMTKPLEPSTLSKYARYSRYLGKNYGEQSLGSIQLESLRRADVIVWASGMADEYAPVTAKEAFRFVQSMLDEARKDGFIASNPAADVQPPVKRGGKKKKTVWLEENARATLRAFIDSILSEEAPGCDRYCEALATEIALFSGLRESEVCALTWGDLELGENPALHVNRSLGRANDEKRTEYYYVKAPKSGAGLRTVPLNGKLLEDLRKYRAEVAKEIEAKALPYTIEELYVIGLVNEGTFRKPRTLNQWFERNCAALGLKASNGERPRFHDLRHTFATVCAHSGMAETSLREIMGHESISTTHDYYIGIDDSANARAMELATRSIIGGGAEVIRFPAAATA